MNKTIFNRFKATLSSLADSGLEGFLYEEEESYAGSTTKGDYMNERASLISFGTGGNHVVRAFSSVSPDIMLCYQSRMTAFNIQTNSSPGLLPVGRDVKSIILNDPHLNF